jgi:glucose-6-phosphate isomerase
MRVEIPDEFTDSKDEFVQFSLPNFVLLMDEFIKIAENLQAEVPNMLGVYDHLGIVGIGGSQVQPLIFNPLSRVSVSHLEVPDPYILRKFMNREVKKTRILYISRSGTTKEVLSHISYLQNFPSLVVTNGGPLLEIANELGFSVLKVSYDVSGRFAIQNELGIVPMVAMGLDPVEFLNALKASYNTNFKEDSIADRLAICLYNLEKSGIAKMRICTSGIYPRGLGILFTQLVNESTPKKETDLLDSSLHFMPRGAHSDLQRWYGGKKDSFLFSFVCNDYTADVIAPVCPPQISELIPGSNLSISAGTNLNITSRAVEDTFPGPVIKIILEKDTLTETALCVGFLHALTVRLCQLKESNPFDQPAVQKYKDRASDIYETLI